MDSYRKYGSAPNYYDLLTCTFSSHNNFLENETVLVPRSRGGFVYGKIYQSKEKHKCLYDSHIYHDWIEWRVVYPNSIGGQLYKCLPSCAIGKITANKPDINDLKDDHKVPEKRYIGELAFENDIVKSVFMKSSNFSEGEVVLVSRSSGGLYYGIISGQKQIVCSGKRISTTTGETKQIKHKVKGYRVFLSESSGTKSRLRKDLFSFNIGKLHNRVVLDEKPVQHSSSSSPGITFLPTINQDVNNIIDYNDNNNDDYDESKFNFVEVSSELDNINNTTNNNNDNNNGYNYQYDEDDEDDDFSEEEILIIGDNNNDNNNDYFDPNTTYEDPEQFIEEEEEIKGPVCAKGGLLVVQDYNNDSNNNNNNNKKRYQKKRYNNNNKRNYYNNNNNRRSKNKCLIVLDAPNIAMKYGKQLHYSAYGIRLCADYWISRGHEVVAFLPEHYITSKPPEKGQNATLSSFMPKIDDIDLIYEMVEENIISLTPPQDYDDSYCILYAKKHNGIIVTNDRYWDHINKQKPQDLKDVKRWIRSHCVSFTFIKDEFLPNPDFEVPK
eukprot:TRINITY_DN6215_c0_g1_i1.p1 TRINITY_DN6215_c0_g1~~TRINITY_DN6215_c0_g1_i1.p1  ORF type:complete len:616 (+),score=223.73 TRINITY_DN6215_c0_g1_i1:194-1849(+)